MSAMSYLMAGRIHVACHRDELPSDEQWREYLEHIGQNLSRIDGIFVYAPGAGPSFDQQRASTRFWSSAERRPPIAVVSGSRLVVRAAGALKWFMPDQIRAFGTWDVAGAFGHLSLDAAQGARTLRVLASLATKLDVDLPPELVSAAR